MMWMRQGVWRGAVLAGLLAAQTGVAQSAPAADQQKQQQTPPAKQPDAQAPAAQTPPAANAPQPGAAQMFPFPEDDSKTKEIPELHRAPDAPAPSAPTPNGPQGSSGKQFPFPGGTGSQVPGGGYSSSSDTAPATPEPDAPVRQKLELTDVGSSGHVDTARAEEDERVADFYIKDGNYAGAYLRYKDAVAFSPDDPDAHYGLAEMARKKGNKDEAMKEYAACMKADAQGKHVKEARKALTELEQEEHKPVTAGAR